MIEMYSCGDAVCGRLLFSPKARTENGGLRANAFNPNEPICGAQMVFDLKQESAEEWRGGIIHDVETGRKANIKVHLKSPNEVEARFYKGIAAIGVTEELTRATKPPPPC